MKRESSFKLPDGRIDPEKAFQFVLSKLKSMTPEEIAVVMKAPTRFQGMTLKEEAWEKAPSEGYEEAP